MKLINKAHLCLSLLGLIMWIIILNSTLPHIGLCGSNLCYITAKLWFIILSFLFILISCINITNSFDNPKK